uniref:RNA-binding protein 18 n=1 Tax=Davidia involucrata TaxID=16924 RepID=A0A5B7A3H3_DAVIN
MQEAKLAKEKMNGKLACGRPLVVRLASEKYLAEASENSAKAVGEANKLSLAGSSSGQMNRSAKIAAIKNKLKAMEEESRGAKKQKQKQVDSISCIESSNPSSVKRSSSLGYFFDKAKTPKKKKTK